jgi:sec-independent protein translocase protein TatC
MKKKKKNHQAEQSSEDQEQPFMSHLVELRDRLLRSVVVVAVFSVALLPFAKNVYPLFARPVMSHLPEGTKMAAIDPASPVITPFLLVVILAVFISIPYLLYQLWSFIAPGLYRHEKQLALPLFASSIVLFYLGMAFAYFVVFPLVFGFVTSFTPEGVSYTPDISRYLYFALKMFFAFGVAFEVPIATILLVAAGITTPEALSEKRPYIIVAAFVVGMLLTPPDIISQTLLAVPMWILFESGVYFSRVLLRKRAEQQAEADAAEEDEDRDLSDEEMEDELDKAIDEEERAQSERDPQQDDEEKKDD